MICPPLSHTDLNESALATRNGTLDQHEVVLLVNAHQLKVADRDAVAAHVAGETETLANACGVSAHAHRTGGAVEVVTMATGTAGKTVTLDDAGETLALADADDVDLVDIVERLDGERVTDCMLGGILDADLAQVAHGRYACLCEVALHGLVYLLFLDVTETDLHGLIAVGVGGLDLRDNAGASLDDGHGDDGVILSPDLRHAQLAAENRVDHYQPYCQAILRRKAVLLSLSGSRLRACSLCT